MLLMETNNARSTGESNKTNENNLKYYRLVYIFGIADNRNKR